MLYNSVAKIRTVLYRLSYIVSDTTILSKTYTDWDTRFGDVSHTVSLLVTPAVVVSHISMMGCVLL